MVKLFKKYVTEAKQVGTLYHSCSAEDLTEYIMPKDILSSSGTFTNFLYGGKHWVSFTRNKNYVVKKNGDWNSQDIYLQFQVNGDLLSEKYKVKPYNDMVYDLKTQSGEKDSSIPYTGYNFENEECVNGPIINFSSYVSGIKYTLSDNANSYDVTVVMKHIQALQDYSKKCGVIPQMDMKLDPTQKGTSKFHGADIESLDNLLSVCSFIYNIEHSLFDMIRENGYTCESPTLIIPSLYNMVKEKKSSILKKNIKQILESLFNTSSQNHYNMYSKDDTGKTTIDNKTTLKNIISKFPKELNPILFSLSGKWFSIRTSIIEIYVVP